jgi:BatD DUF11 like domain
MRRLFLILCLLAPLCASAQSPVVRAHLEPGSNIMVGQPVRLVVSVFVPNYFTGAPDFPEFELENAIVVLPQDRPEHSNTQIGNATYFGITQTYIIYPQQPGDYHLPPAKFSVPYAIAPPKTTTAEVTLPTLSFHADVPAAARDLPYFLPTTQLTITQHWSRPLKGLQTGDTVERTITITAAKMQAMLIPPLTLDPPDGIRLYNSEPRVDDHKTPRGDFIYGQRVETARYFIEKPGHYSLPAIQLTWWNLSIKHPVTATLAETKFTAVENSNYKVELPTPPEVTAPAPHMSLWARYRFWIRVAAPACVALFFVVWLSWRYLPRLSSNLRNRLERRKHSEAAYFRNLLKACESDRPVETYQQLLRWLAIGHPGSNVDDFVGVSADPRFASEARNLGEYLFCQEHADAWHGKKLAESLRRHRRNSPSASTQSKLVELNPKASSRRAMSR